MRANASLKTYDDGFLSCQMMQFKKLLKQSAAIPGTRAHYHAEWGGHCELLSLCCRGCDDARIPTEACEGDCQRAHMLLPTEETMPKGSLSLSQVDTWPRAQACVLRAGLAGPWRILELEEGVQVSTEDKALRTAFSPNLSCPPAALALQLATSRDSPAASLQVSSPPTPPSSPRPRSGLRQPSRLSVRFQSARRFVPRGRQQQQQQLVQRAWRPDTHLVNA